MPLDVVRLRDSDLAANETPEACWAAVLLWAASWHQVPAGSMPDDERWIAKAAGYVSRGKIDKAWPEIRPGAMRGFVLCTDARWYHPVVAEKAREAWTGKLKQRWMTECARVKKYNQRHRTDIEVPDFDVWLSLGCPQGHAAYVPRDTAPMSPGTSHPCPPDVPRETHSKGQGEGQGEGQGQGQSIKTPPPPAHTHAREGSLEVAPVGPDWQPSEGFIAKAKGAGLPVSDQAFLDAGLIEFRLYWGTRPGEMRTQAEWEHALVKSLKRDQVTQQGQAARAQRRPAPDPVETPRQRHARQRVAEAAGVFADQVAAPPPGGHPIRELSDEEVIRVDPTALPFD